MKRYDWKKRPEELCDVIADLEQYWSSDTKLNEVFLRNFYGRPTVQLNDVARTVLELAMSDAIVDTGWKLTREVVETALATIARPLHGVVMPVGADNEMQRNCRTITRLSDGIDENCDFEDKSQRVFLDGALTSIGVLRGRVIDGEIVAERVLPGHFFVLPAERENPVHFFVTSSVPRELVDAEYPGKDVDSVGGYSEETIAGVDPITASDEDNVLVCEAWAISRGKLKGRYVKTVGKIVLEDEKYDVKWPPLAFFRWSYSHKHFIGSPLAAQIAPYHEQTNQAIHKLNKSFEGAVPRIVAQAGSLVTPHSDEAFSLVEYQQGRATPIIEKTEPASEQLIRWIPEIRARCFAECGVSEMIASSQRPQGLDSEPSQLAWVDIASIRGQSPAKHWQNFYKQWMRVKLGLAATTYTEKGARIRSPGSDLIDEIKWPMDIDEDKYQFRVAVKSALSLTVSGRMQETEHLRKLLPTQFTESDAARAIGLTDVEKASDRANAEMDMVEHLIDLALVEGEGQIPSEIMGTSGLENLVRVGRQAYLMAVMKNNHPPANVELLRRVIQAAQGVLTPAAPPMSAPIPPPVPPMPGIDPAMPPMPPIDTLPPPVAPPIAPPPLV